MAEVTGAAAGGATEVGAIAVGGTAAGATAVGGSGADGPEVGGQGSTGDTRPTVMVTGVAVPTATDGATAGAVFRMATDTAGRS
jgi:hypothetical protein